MGSRPAGATTGGGRLAIELARDKSSRHASPYGSRLVGDGGGSGGSGSGSGNGSGGGEALLIPVRAADGGTVTRRVGSPPSDEQARSTGLGRFAQAAQLWEAVSDLLADVVSHVRVDDEVFDEVVDLLADSLAQNDKYRAALDVVNADAVWLTMYRRGQTPWMAAPAVDSGLVSFVEMEQPASP